MNNSDKGKFGEKWVRNYLQKEGYKLLPKKEKGSDIIAKKGNKQLTIEVKTTSNFRGGIPDMHDTEFKNKRGKWHFVADKLFVVRIKGNKPKQLDILTKSDVDKFAHTHKTIIRIRTKKLDRELFKGKVGKSIKL